MASFISNVYDSNNNLINCNYKGYHVQTGKWSNIHITQYNQISFDNEDKDWDGLGTAFKSGDTILIYAWTKTECSVMSITSTGASSYSPDIQIRGCIKPSINLITENGTINHTITLNNTNSTEYQWRFKNNTFYHKNTWYGQQICDLGTNKVEYNFGLGYNTSNTHIYNNIGVKQVKLKVTNECGLVTEQTKSIKIYNNKPIVKISANTLTPFINENVKFVITNSDPDYTIINQNYTIDNVKTQKLDFLFSDVGNHIFKVITTYNDGFEDKSFSTSVTINMKALSPTINMEVKDIDSNSYSVISNAVDPQNKLSYVNLTVYEDVYNIFNKNPKDVRWVEISNGKETSLKTNIFLKNSGIYKITEQAFNEYGLSSAIDEKIIQKSDTSKGCGCNIDWTKTIHTLDIIVNVYNINIEFEVFNIDFNIKKENINIDIKNYYLPIIIHTHNINFIVDSVCKK